MITHTRMLSFISYSVLVSKAPYNISGSNSNTVYGSRDLYE